MREDEKGGLDLPEIIFNFTFFQTKCSALDQYLFYPHGKVDKIGGRRFLRLGLCPCAHLLQKIHIFIKDDGSPAVMLYVVEIHKYEISKLDISENKCARLLIKILTQTLSFERSVSPLLPFNVSKIKSISEVLSLRRIVGIPLFRISASIFLSSSLSSRIEPVAGT